MSQKVRVYRNILRTAQPDKPWMVGCDYCAGEGSPFGAYYGLGVKGWAPNWRTAIDYALRHACEHETTRCPTCLHVPAIPTPSEQGANA